VCVVAILVCSLLGGWFGQKMVKKHFEKAGIV
jgi:energy-coupling factor transport system substrate-specific component